MDSIIKKIIHVLLNILDKEDNNFKHQMTYVSKNEIPVEDRHGIFRIYENGEWIEKGIWIGNQNEHYDDVLKKYF